MNQIQKLRTDLASRFVERRELIDLSLCTVLSGENLMILGPVGTAKSALARAVASAFGGRYMEALVNRFTVPEELLGPVSLKALERDSYERIIDGKLPAVEFCFLDEIYKASSAILNVLLGILADRVYVNGGQVVKCPLISVFAASNELPDARELAALHDRFLVRATVDYMRQPASLRAVMLAPDPVPTITLTLADLQKAQADAMAVKIGDDVVDVVLLVRDALRADGIVASDRRWKRCLKLIRAATYLAGEAEATQEDVSIIVDALWDTPQNRPRIARLVGKIADPVGTQAQEIVDAAREAAQKIAALKATDRRAFISAAASAIDQFTAQQSKLQELGRAGGRRAKVVIADAQAEIQALHAEAARGVSAGLGLGMRAVR